jgi:hypothetical protein
MLMKTVALWDMTATDCLWCVTGYHPTVYDLPITILVCDYYQTFGKAFSLNLQGNPRKMWTLQAPPKYRQLITNKNSAISLYNHLVSALLERTVELRLSFVPFSDSFYGRCFLHFNLLDS